MIFQNQRYYFVLPLLLSTFSPPVDVNQTQTLMVPLNCKEIHPSFPSDTRNAPGDCRITVEPVQVRSTQKIFVDKDG